MRTIWKRLNHLEYKVDEWFPDRFGRIEEAIGGAYGQRIKRLEAILVKMLEEKRPTEKVSDVTLLEKAAKGEL